MDYTVHEILRAWILEWVAFPFSIGSSQPRDWTQVSCTVGGFFTSWATRAQLFSHSVMSNSLPPHGLQHARLPCPSLSPRVCPNSHSLSWWCHLILFHPFLLKPSIFPSNRDSNLYSCIAAPHCSHPFSCQELGNPAKIPLNLSSGKTRRLKFLLKYKV